MDFSSLMGGGTTGAGGGGGSSYQSEARSTLDSALHSAFGDVNVGAGAGSGRGISPGLIAAALGIAGIVLIFLFRRK